MEPIFLCRTCTEEKDDLLEIFSEEGAHLNLFNKLQSYFHLDITEYEIYTAMCFKCIDLLNDFDGLYQRVKASEGRFPKDQLGKAMVPNNDREFPDDTIKNEYKIEEIVIEEAEEYSAILGNEDTEGQSVGYETEVEETFTEIAEDDSTEECESDEQPIPSPRLSPLKDDSTIKPIKAVKGLKEKSGKNRLEEDAIINSLIVLKCEECGCVRPTFDELVLHYRSAHNSKRGYVKCCGRNFYRRHKLLEHCQLHINPSAFQCDLCQRTFSASRLLKNHMECHIPEEERQFPCDKCPKRCATKARLLLHLNTHNEDYSFQCKLCDKSFNQKLNLDAHIRYAHNPKRTFVCEICAKEFKTKEWLAAHQANHLDTPQPKETCGICGLKLKNQLSLKQHLRHHQKAHERHACNICGKYFNSKKRVTQHRKLVHDAPQFKCLQCPKEFKRKINLKEHMAMHTGESLYTCKYCPREFKSNANKYAHQKAQHPVEWEAEMRKKKEG